VRWENLEKCHHRLEGVEKEGGGGGDATTPVEQGHDKLLLKSLEDLLKNSTNEKNKSDKAFRGPGGKITACREL
jgi:hypothetical protein